ncbi:MULTISPECIES: GDSL-type esterase/lipase family protein [Sphingobacterium]|uniref:GDSL-type esterase/lipase family protein n=1 Tax=Sphingobacterium TaxID=28453 RepID=UPI000E831AC6|nr:GDSL-type esterase/lipase family protein [Sphingobacterium multivorum]HAU54243.1 sialate O-acetylesterase [Sphingobacterium sp.]HCX56512.1 sialate O-acetylesterase [Sphingobacterium sp.]
MNAILASIALQIWKKLSLFLCLLLPISISWGQPRIKVACIGNSVTFGYGLANPAQDSYPSQLQALLGDRFEVGNFGHSGATLLRKGHRPYYKTAEYRKALDFKPDVAIIHLGLNDTDPRNWPNYKNSFASDYATLIDSIRSVNPKMKIYICQLTPIFSGHPRFLSGTRDWYDQIQAEIPQIAESNQVGLIDLHSPLQARIDLFNDYLHPNRQGATLMARQVAGVLAPMTQDLQVGETIGSDMVLQRNWENRIYGKGTAAAEVKVVLNKKSYKTIVNRDGYWQLRLPKMEAGGPYEITVSSAGQKIELKNILFGDVYLASGQSNMAFQLRRATKSASLINTAADRKNLRLFKCQNLVETNAVAWDSTVLKKVNDLAYFHGNWRQATADDAAQFSAVAYSFAEQIAREQHIPIGIIDLSVGGSNTESWIDRKCLENDNLLASYIHNWQKSDFLQDFCRERASQNLALSKVKNQRHPYQPAYNFEAGVSKWLGTGLKGILWYQGESNAHNIELHEHLFKTLVSSWRKSFQQDLPFFFVQLTSIDRPSWGDFRNSQRLLEKQIEGTYMAVTLDVGDSLDVHPHEKLVVGQRLANLASKHLYGVALNADHPDPIQQEIHGDKLLLTFDHCITLKTKGNYRVKGFQLVDSRGKIFDVSARIVSGNAVEINIPHTKGNRLLYGYEPFSRANLQNEIGTPVSTFDLAIK